MRVLIGCESSGITVIEFNKLGHEVWSCDLNDSEVYCKNHFKGDILELLDKNIDFDLMIAYPPCTHLAISGARHFHYKQKLQDEALSFFVKLFTSKIPRVCLENPVGIISTRFIEPSQYIEPYYFGEPYTKKTGLWLRGLNLLEATDVVKPLYSYAHTVSGAKARAKTFQGIAKAMAEQWTKEIR